MASQGPAMKKTWLFFLFWIAFQGLNKGQLVLAGEPTKDPILRIENGMHTASISRIGSDAQNRFLVTGSDDKTVRLWELPTGRLVKILRPPIGIGNEGKIYAVALSPDGRTIACGGLPSSFEATATIYLFDRESGRLIKRVLGLPRAIHHLAFSKNGQYLAAGLGGNNGIRIYRTVDWSLAAEDKEYGDSCYWTDFDPQGRLVSVAMDGFIRLYDREFQRGPKVRSKGRERPFSVSFSPDGTKVAVGYILSQKMVEVLSAKDLSPLYVPDTTGVNNDLGIVAWSADGRFLFAAGMYSLNGTFIRKWSEGGRGPRMDILTETNDSIMHLLSLPGGGIAFGSSEPAFGVIDGQDQKILYKSSLKMDFRGIREVFHTSQDGTTIQFSDLQDKVTLRFSIKDRFLESSPSAAALKSDQRLIPPIINIEGFEVTDWQNRFAPKLNGAPLELDRYERVRSLAISPQRDFFLLGTEWYLRFFDIQGKEKWRVLAPDAAWGVNISGDGQVAVAAFGDGTIRWYGTQDGRELLALYSHKDKRRWVLWALSGEYDTSPGGEEIIGWHVNNGKDQAAGFFPASRFRNTYYQPETVAQNIFPAVQKKATKFPKKDKKPEQTEIAASKILPPVVEILSPADGAEMSSPDLALKFTVRSPTGESITQVRVLIDGHPVSTERRVWKMSPHVSELKEVSVQIPAQDADVSVIVENKFAASQPATVRLKWKGGGANLEPRSPQVYRSRGKTWSANGDLTRAIADYSRAVELDPAYTLAYKDRADTYLKLNQHEAALRDYKKVIVLDPSDAAAVKNHTKILLDKGKEAGNAGDIDAAIRMFTDIFTVAPNNQAAFFHRGIAFFKREQFKEALLDFTEAIKLDSSDALAYLERGVCHYQLDNFQLAIQDFTSAISLKPDDPRAYRNRGSALFGKGDYDSAIRDYGTSISLDPKSALAYLNRAETYRKVGRHEDALRDYDKAIENRPDDPEIPYKRGLTYWHLKKRNLALTDLRRAANLGFKDARDFLAKQNIR